MPSPQSYQPYTVATVACGHCKQKQVVQILARTDFGWGHVIGEMFEGWEFAVVLPDAIIGGPFFPQRVD
jgi:hypothetical protein